LKEQEKVTAEPRENVAEKADIDIVDFGKYID
jgi:hypothetical protein